MILNINVYVCNMKVQENYKGKLLIVDDEPDIREILQVNLEVAGYEVITAPSAEDALLQLDASVSLILLDVMLGGMSGYALARKLRQELNNQVPIIFLTAKDTENDLLTGFSAGGDDYISKPFSIHEVIARVGAVVRRRNMPGNSETNHINIGNIEIIPDRKLVRSNGADIILTPKEYGILKMLVSSPGRVYSRDEILHKVWQDDSLVLERTVDVHITRIRSKLGEAGAQIVNRQGYGYCFIEK